MFLTFPAVPFVPIESTDTQIHDQMILYKCIYISPGRRGGNSSIVVVKALPVLECRQCGEIEMEDQTMRRVDQALARVDASAELEIIRFAA
jgi:hypothetical protein